MSKEKKKKICFISSSGGHLEQIKQLKGLTDKYDHFYVVPKTKSTVKMEQKKYLVSEFSRKNKLVAIFKLGILTLKEFFIFIKERPSIIITTGAGVAVPMCFFGHLFKKKVIYIESFAKIKTPNKTGKIIYDKGWYDLFVVQWESLLEVYPKATYWGWIY